jgi:hypothetical protein
MKNIAFFIFLLLIFTANVDSAPAASDNDRWPPSIQAHVDTLLKNGISEKEIASITQAMIQARFTEEEIINLQNMVMQAYMQGVPLASLTGKILEGIAKHVQPTSIIQATQRITLRYTQSTRLAAKLTMETKERGQWEELIATGNAAGLPFQNMEKIVQQLQQRQNEQHFSILANEILITARDMARQSVDPGALTEIIDLAIKKGFTAQDVHELNRVFWAQTQQHSLATVTENCISLLQKENSPEAALHGFSSGKRQGSSKSQGLNGSGRDASSQSASNGNSNGSGSTGDSNDTSAGHSSNGGESGSGNGGADGNGNGNGNGNGK